MLDIKKNIENWKYIKGYDGLYSISHEGLVKSHHYSTNNRLGEAKNIKEKIMTPTESNKCEKRSSGYLTVRLTKNKTGKTCYIHRLVAETFIPNPNNYPTVNHIDGNKHNNHISNLEWCTYSENNQHAHDTGLKNDRISVVMRDISSNVILQIFDSISDASRYVIGSTNGTGQISQACKKNIVSAHGYKWDYYEDDMEIGDRFFSRVSSNNSKNKNTETVLPIRSTKVAGGYDFVTPVDLEIKPQDKIFFWTDIKSRMQEKEVLLLDIRSSMGIKNDLMMSNTIPIIDSDYYNNCKNEGNIGISIRNVKPNFKLEGYKNIVIRGNKEEDDNVIQVPVIKDLTKENTVFIKAGERICQGIFIPFLVADNGNTDKERCGGIGSTN